MLCLPIVVIALCCHSWLSQDGGVNWVLASGVTVDGDGDGTPAALSSFPTEKNNGANFALMPSTGAIVRLSQEVYLTSNVVTWRPQTLGNYELRNLPTLVATSTGTLIRAAGQVISTLEFQNDVITSTDSGRTWLVATEKAAWTARFVNTMLTIPSSIDGGRDITYVIAGRNMIDNFNDV